MGASWLRNSCGNCLNSKIATLAFRRRQIVAMHECVRIWATTIMIVSQDPRSDQMTDTILFCCCCCLICCPSMGGKIYAYTKRNTKFSRVYVSIKKIYIFVSRVFEMIYEVACPELKYIYVQMHTDF